MIKSPVLIISLILNILLLGIVFTYMFTPLLDWAVVINSHDRICRTQQGKLPPDALKNFCK